LQAGDIVEAHLQFLGESGKGQSNSLNINYVVLPWLILTSIATGRILRVAKVVVKKLGSAANEFAKDDYQKY